MRNRLASAVIFVTFAFAAMIPSVHGQNLSSEKHARFITQVWVAVNWAISNCNLTSGSEMPVLQILSGEARRTYAAAFEKTSSEAQEVIAKAITQAGIDVQCQVMEDFYGPNGKEVPKLLQRK